MVSRQPRRSGTTAPRIGGGRQRHRVDDDKGGIGGAGQRRKDVAVVDVDVDDDYYRGAGGNSPTMMAPSPDKTAASTDVDDDDLGENFDVGREGGGLLVDGNDGDDCSLPPRARGGCDAFNGIGLRGRNNRGNNKGNNKGNNDDGRAGLSPPSPSPPPTQAPTTTTATGLISVDKILCRMSSQSSNISDLSASLSPMNSRPWATNSVIDVDNDDNNNRNNRIIGGVDGGGNDNRGILMTVLNECGVLEGLVGEVLRGGGGGGSDGEDHSPSPPPPPPPPAAPSPPAADVGGKKRKDGGGKKGGGGFCTDYQKPAIWGLPPDGDDDTNEDLEATVGGGNDDDHDDVVEEEGEEYDNVELILDESRTAPPPSTSMSGRVAAPPPPNPDASAGSAVGRKAPMRSRLKKPMTKLSLGRNNNKLARPIENDDDRDNYNNEDDAARHDVVVGEKKKARHPVHSTGSVHPPTAEGVASKATSRRTESPRERESPPPPAALAPAAVPISGTKKGVEADRTVAVEPISYRKSLSFGGSRRIGGGVGGDAVRPDPPESPDRGEPDTTFEEEVEVDDLLLPLSSENEAYENKNKYKKSRMGLLKGLSHKQKPSSKKETLTLSTDGVDPPSTATDGAVNSKGIDDGGEEEINVPANTTVTDAVDVNKDKNRRKSMSLGRHKRSIEEAPENQTAATTAGVAAAATTSGSSSEANLANATKKEERTTKKKERKPKTITASAAAIPTAKDIKEAKNWKYAYDRSCEKYYYYNKETMAVSWDKPFGYDVAHGGVKNQGGEEKDTARSKKIIGLMGRGRKAASAKDSNEAPLPGLNPVGTYDQAKYWHETLDSTTKKVYYYNKKTKEVSWTKPTCLVDVTDVDKSKVDEGGNGTTKAEVDAESESHLEKIAGSVAIKRKKLWFKLGGSVERNAKMEEIKATPADEDVVVVDTILDDILLPAKDAPVTQAEPTLAKAAAPDEVDDSGKHWRAASDAITGETYYFNKKTKAVSWTKPACFKDKEEHTNPSVDRGVTKTIVMAVATAAAAAATTVATAAAAAAATVTTAVQDHTGDRNDDIEKAATQQPFTVDDLSVIEDFTDAKDIGNHVKVQEDAPFDEPEAPFDEPMSSSNKVVTLVPHEFKEQEDDDLQEQEDSFDQDGNWPLGLKSRKPSDQVSRQRTFASHSSASTRKAANTPRHRLSYGKSFDRIDDATFDNSLNNSSIASDVFDDNHKITQGKNKAKSSKVASENILWYSQENKLPQLPKTPPRILPRPHISSKTKEESYQRYTSKRAENLGDSSVDDSIDKDPPLDQYWSSDDNDDDATDDVSALSGIGNESIASKKKKKNVKRGDAGGRKDMEPINNSSESSSKKNGSGTINPWTQQELDLFISKNDWGSVAEYINEMRANKGASSKKQQDAIRKELSMNQKTIENDVQSSVPKKKSTRQRQIQYDEMTPDSPSAPSAGLESESVWQSLSSSTSDSEE